MKTVAILIGGLFALAVVDGAMVVAPLLEPSIDGVFIGKNGAAHLNRSS